MANLKYVTKGKFAAAAKTSASSKPSHDQKRAEAKKAVEDFYRRHGEAMTILAYE